MRVRKLRILLCAPANRTGGFSERQPDEPALEVAYVRRTGARRVYTVHGFAEEFAADLRRRGCWAEPLRESGPQLTLGLDE